MKNKIIIIISVLTIILALASCKKTPTVSAYPSLTLTSPTQGQNFASGATVHIMGTATASATDDAHLLHEMSITITRVSDHSQVWLADISTHDEESHMIDTSFALPHPSVRDSFVVEAVVVNHLLNQASQKIGFTVNP